MRPARAILSKSQPDVKAIVHAWRVLTGPIYQVADRSGHLSIVRAGKKVRMVEKTLVACSGGADSVALVLALATATDKLVVGHVVHDIREESETLADRDVARKLAARLGLEFAEAKVQVRGGRNGDMREGPKNLEARARSKRYAALAVMADAHDCRFIATAQHADDQLETMLMSLMRGAGPGGMCGMWERRVITDPKVKWKRTMWIIRPMLAAPLRGGVTREVCRAMCVRAGVEWREDSTNADVSRVRAALRHRVVPILKEMRPNIAAKAVSVARMTREAQSDFHDAVSETVRAWGTNEDGKGGYGIRYHMARTSKTVVGESFRRLYRHYIGEAGLDTLSSWAITPIVEAICTEYAPTKEFFVGDARVIVDNMYVRVIPRKGPNAISESTPGFGPGAEIDSEIEEEL